jgi:hypothetical protein
MQTNIDIATEARTIIDGFEERNISNPWFAAQALIFTAAWLIGDLSRSETDRAQHIANLRAILEACAKSRFEQTHSLRN